MSGESVCFAILDAGAVDDGIFVMVNFFGPASLVAGEDASGLEVFEVFVVVTNIISSYFYAIS